MQNNAIIKHQASKTSTQISKRHLQPRGNTQLPALASMATFACAAPAHVAAAHNYVGCTFIGFVQKRRAVGGGGGGCGKLVQGLGESKLLDLSRQEDQFVPLSGVGCSFSHSCRLRQQPGRRMCSPAHPPQPALRRLQLLLWLKYHSLFWKLGCKQIN